MRQTRTAIAALLAALVLAACAPTTALVSTWSDDNRPARPYRNLVVFGLAPNKKVRDAYEKSFVAALERHGARATAGHSLVRSGGLASAKAMRMAVEHSGADGVILPHLRATKRTGAATPGNHVDRARDGRLDGYYRRIYTEVTEPDYYATDPALQLQTSLYDFPRAILVWSARSAAISATSESTTIGDVIDATADALALAGYLPR